MLIPGGTGPELICYPAPKVARGQDSSSRPEDDEGGAGRGRCGPDLQVLSFQSGFRAPICGGVLGG